MPESTERLTVDQILAALHKEGYQLSRRTFQYYVQTGLLPKGMRKGAAAGGVQFFYPTAVVARMRLIFTLKARGFKLSEIKEQLDDLPAPDEIEPPAPSPAAFPARPAPAAGKRQRQAPPPPAPGMPEPSLDLYERVMALTPGGEALRRCLQCGTCGGSCPSAMDMDFTPRHLFALLQAGNDREVLASNTAWFCISCYYCTVRCPQEIPITELMFTIKEIAARAGIVKITEAHEVSRIYVSLIEKYGRSFDIGLAFRYHLTHAPTADDASWGGLSLKLHRRERVVSGPSRIRDIRGLQRIIAKAKEIRSRE